MITFKTTSFNQFAAYINFFRRRYLQITTSSNDLNYSITVYRLNKNQTEKLLNDFTTKFNLTHRQELALAA